MNKAVDENKFAVMLKMTIMRIQFVLEINVYRRIQWFASKKLLPLSPSPVTPVFLVAEQLLNLRLWNIQSFNLFLLTALRKIELNCMSGSFFTEIFFNFMVFNPSKSK